MSVKEEKPMLQYKYSCDFKGCAASEFCVMDRLPPKWGTVRLDAREGDDRAEVYAHLCEKHCTSIGKLLSDQALWTVSERRVDKAPKRFR